jgi:hypothetical protein
MMTDTGFQYSKADATEFRDRLDLAMKALSISRGRLAADLAIDKSVVTRWLAGRVTPTSHNLARLTRYIAGLRPGFSMLDWDVDPGTFAARLGVGALPEATNLLPHAVMVEAQALTRLRGPHYEGLWRCIRPSDDHPGQFAMDRLIIRRGGNGLLSLRLGTKGHQYQGWIFPSRTQLFVIATDDLTGLFLFGVFNAPPHQRAEALEGLMLSVCCKGAGTPLSYACHLERDADLSGNHATDDAAFEALQHLERRVLADAPSAAIRQRLLRDIGPSALARGGEALLSMGFASSLSRGSPLSSMPES